jgi:hypothetical protein
MLQKTLKYHMDPSKLQKLMWLQAILPLWNYLKAVFIVVVFMDTCRCKLFMKSISLGVHLALCGKDVFVLNCFMF